MLDVVHRSRHGAFGDGYHALGHLFGRQTGIGPNNAENGNVDVRKDVLRHHRDSDAAQHAHQDGHDDEGIGTAKRESNDPHGEPEQRSDAAGVQSVSFVAAMEFGCGSGFERFQAGCSGRQSPRE